MKTRFQFAPAIALAVALTLTGCTQYRNYYPGGGYTSLDRFTYESTSWTPQTVTIRDTRTGQDIWSIDVPVGQKVVVWFRRGEGPDDVYPDAMEWDVFDLDVNHGKLTNKIGVPASTARVVLATLRPAPEMPGETLAPEDYVQPAPLPAESEADSAEPATDPATDEAPADDDPNILTPEEAGEDG